MAAKKKSRDLLLAEIAFEAGRECMFKTDDDPEVVNGPEKAIKEWKAQCNGRLPPSDIDKAHEKWIEAGRPKEGIVFKRAWYMFDVNGAWLQKESFEKNFEL